MKYFLSISIFVFSWLSASSQITQGKNDVVKTLEVNHVYITQVAIPFDSTIKPAKKEILVKKNDTSNTVETESKNEAIIIQAIPLNSAIPLPQKKSIIVDSTYHKTVTDRTSQETKTAKKLE